MKSTIIVDVEWDPDSKIQSPEVLQIAAVKLNNNNQISDSYYSCIKPYNGILNKDRLDFMKENLDNILNGKEKNIVLKEFSSWCGNNPLYVIWGSTNYQVYKSFVIEHLVVSIENTIDLQLAFSLHFEEEIMSIERKCKTIGIEILGPLHHSLADAKLVAELYKFIQLQVNIQDIISNHYIKREEIRKEKRRKKRKIKKSKIKKLPNTIHKVQDIKYPYDYFIICKSGEIHKKGCIALCDVNVDEMKGFQTFENAIKESKKTCSICFKANVNLHPALTSSQLTNLIELHSLCYEFGLHSQNFERTFIVQTAVGSWYFVIETRPTILYHRNFIFEERNLQGALCGYHRQPKGNFKSDREVILYINRHDQMLLKGKRKIMPKQIKLNNIDSNE